MRPLFALLLLTAQLRAEPRSANLVVDGVPELPRSIGERSRPYENARGAALLDWEPSGKGVLIATRFAETAQVHHVAMPGGARRQLTFFAEPVADALYAPKRAGGFFFRMDAGGGEFYQYHWFELATGAHTLVTDGKSRHEGLLASRAGKLALVGTARNGTDFDLYVVDENDPHSLARVKELTGQWTPLDWSPDEKSLLLRHYVSAAESHLHTIALDGGALAELNASAQKIAYGPAAFARKGGAIYYSSDEDSEFLRLTRFDLASGKKQVLTPSLSWDVDGLALSDDGAWLAYTANEGGMSALYLARAAQPLKAERIKLPTGVISRLKFDRQSKRLGFTLSTAQSTADVYSIDVETRALTRWTESEVGGLDPARFVAPERVRFPSFDGRELDAWYYRPARSDGRKLPVVISIHGGPEAQATAAFNPTVQYWVNELGVAVLQPNVRGSAGYGKSFLKLDDAARREDSVKDIGALLDWIGKRPELDAARVAVFGGSYGGYMVLASLEHFSERLRCGVEIVGISNFVTFLEHTESYRRELRRAEYGDERDPELRKVLLAISPMTNAAKIKRPLFVAQGQNDPRVPASEAEQIVKAVRAAGGPVWYVLAKDEGHGFQKKANRDYFTDAVTRFFEEYLLK